MEAHGMVSEHQWNDESIKVGEGLAGVMGYWLHKRDQSVR